MANVEKAAVVTCIGECQRGVGGGRGGGRAQHAARLVCIIGHSCTCVWQPRVARRRRLWRWHVPVVRRVRLRRRLSQPRRAARAERVVRAGVRLHQRRHVHEHMSTAAGHCSSTRDDVGARTPLAIAVITGVLSQLSQPLRLWTRLHHRAQVHHAALGPCSMSTCRLYTPTAMAAVLTVPTSVLTSPFALRRGCLSASVVAPVAARWWPPRGRHRQRAPSWSGERIKGERGW